MMSTALAASAMTAGLMCPGQLTKIGVRTPPSKGDCLERSKSTEGLSVRGIQPLSAM